jgi:diguanylate cyclase (GGDEF)-like protein
VVVTGGFHTRLRWQRDEVVATLETTQPAVVARAFTYLFGLGALLVSLAPALPGAQLSHAWLVYGAAAIAVVVSVGVLVTYDRTPEVILRCLPGVGTVLVNMVLLGTRADAVEPYALLYFWVVLSAFYFFGRNLGLLHLLLVVISFAVVLVVDDVPQAPMLWLMSLGTLAVTGVMLALLRQRADTLILSLDAAAKTDALTGVLNRRALDDRFAEELARVQRTRRPLSVLVADLDGFKQINDRFGHQAGDEILQQLAHALSDGRRIDKVGRLGGDEFAVLLPETDAEGAIELARRICATLETAEVRAGLQPKISIGIASWPHDGTDGAGLIDAADVALYVAKRRGGDQVVRYEASMREVVAR